VRQSDQVVREQTHGVRVPEPAVELVQDGTRLSVEAVHQCRVQRERYIETTSTYGRTSRVGTPMVTMAVGGTAGVVLGSLFAANVFGFPPERSASPADRDGFTQETALIGGIVMIGVGAALTTVATVHGFGLLGTDDEVAQRTERLDPEGPPRSCVPPAPVSGATVSLVARDRTEEIGVLGADGRLTLDAARAIAPEFVLRHVGMEVPLEVAGHATGAVVRMDPFQQNVDERVWARAEASQCAAAQQASDCVGLERYLRLFPEGLHAQQAQQLLDQAHARLAERAARLEEQRRAEEERRLAEQQQRLAEQERLRQEAERRWQQRLQEQEHARREATEARRRAREQRERRRECRATCRSSCASNRACTQRCVAQQCR